MTPIGEGCGGGDDCPVSAHAATGWCLVATGAPVLVVTTLPCPPGDPATDITITLIDPTTGAVVLPQAVAACGEHAWEVNQLCDYDENGVLIATFIQIFEFDEDTGVLTITNVRADDPTIVYVPTGTVQTCTVANNIDVEMTSFCYLCQVGCGGGSPPERHGWHAWIFLNGVHTGDLYYDAAGVELAVAPTVLPCPDPATEVTLAAILEAVADLDVNTDGLEACCDAGNVLLAAIDGNTNDLEAFLTTIIGHVDGLEDCCAASNVLLAAISATLTTIDTHVDGIETLIGATNTTLTAIDGHVDGLEACCASTNALLTSLLAVGNCSASAAFTHGQNTDIDSGAAEQIVVGSNPACNGVLVKAMPLNTGIVYIGIVGVTTVTGYPLEAGDTVTIPVDNANKIYAITDVDDQAVAWIAS